MVMQLPGDHALINRALCEQWDRDDPLATCRQSFKLPPDVIYLDGNSLGPLPRTVATALQNSVVDDWGSGLIRSWNDAGWFEMPQQLGDRLGGLIGAASGTVVVSDSTSINLYKAIAAALSLRPDRHVIVSEHGNFPTDLYITEGIQSERPQLIRRLLGQDGDDLKGLIDDDVAVVVLTHVNFRSAQIHDMQAITRLAHQHGAIIVWDLAHSAGVLEIELDQWEVDFAVGCTYKYLNGGPGAPAFIYVAERHQGIAMQPLTGWFGHSQPFEFDPSYDAARDIRQFLCGTPPVLSFVALASALDIYRNLDMKEIRQKSLQLTDLFIALVDIHLKEWPFEVRSPRTATDRGSHVSIGHENAYALMQALIDAGVLGDFRAPDNMRFGFAPLFNNYVEVWDAIEKLREIMTSERFRQPEFNVRRAVT